MAQPSCVALDFETAGYYGHSACAIGMSRIENNRICEQFYCLVRPPSSRVYFTHIHGFTWKILKNEKTFPEVWPYVMAFIGQADYILAHNASFDRGVLAACCAHFGLPYPNIPFLCTLKGSRKAFKLPSYSLGNICGHLDIDLQHHHAGSDARACALIYMELKNRGIADMQMKLREPRDKASIMA